MYQPKNQEKKSGWASKQFDGVIFNFIQDRRNEAEARFREFVKSPLAWVKENQPVRKAVLLESLELLRPGIDVEYEHKIEKWKARPSSGI